MRDCRYCGKPIKNRRSNARHCSAVCTKRANSERAQRRTLGAIPQPETSVQKTKKTSVKQRLKNMAREANQDGGPHILWKREIIPNER